MIKILFKNILEAILVVFIVLFPFLLILLVMFPMKLLFEHVWLSYGYNGTYALIILIFIIFIIGCAIYQTIKEVKK